MAANRRYRCIYLLGPNRMEVRTLDIPDPKDGEMVIRVDAAATCGTDVKVLARGGHPRMISPPAPFGHEMAGTVIASRCRFAEGDRVVILNSASCGRCPACLAGRENLCEDLIYLNGAYGEYLLVPERFVKRSSYHLPEKVPTAAGPLVEPLACVVHGLSLLRRQGSSALVLGLGPMGILWTMVLSDAGWDVTGADPVEKRREAALEFGASSAFDPRTSASEAKRVDLAVDATGTPQGWEQAVASLKPGGTALLFGGCPPGTKLCVETEKVHYSELSLLGSYHHTPASARKALEFLTANHSRVLKIYGMVGGLDDVPEALETMRRKEILKALILPHKKKG